MTAHTTEATINDLARRLQEALRRMGPEGSAPWTATVSKDGISLRQS